LTKKRGKMDERAGKGEASSWERIVSTLASHGSGRAAVKQKKKKKVSSGQKDLPKG